MSLFDIRNPYITVTAFYALNLPEYSMYPHSHHRCEIMYPNLPKKLYTD